MGAILTEGENYTSRQWRSYGVMLLTNIIVVGFAFGIGQAFNLFYPLPGFAVDIFEFTGYVLWGTGMAKPRISHFVNCSQSKALNRHLQLFCAEVGIFSFVLARTLG